MLLIIHVRAVDDVRVEHRKGERGGGAYDD